MSNTVNPLAQMAAAPAMGQNTKQTKEGTWFEAMARAWGEALDNQASAIQTQSDQLSGGNDTPAAITELTAQSLKMSFLSSSSHTAISSVGSSLETMARKQ